MELTGKTTDVITIFGKRGSGKSLMGKHLVQKYKRRFIYDPMGEYGAYGKVVYNLDEIDIEQDSQIVFNPIMQEDGPELHDAVSAWVWRYFPNCIYLTDEIHNYQGATMTPNFRKIITQGRHKGIGLMCISQRYANVNQTITTQSKHIFVFKLFGRDIEVSKSYFGKTIEDKLKNLKEYHFYYFNTDWDEGKLMKPLDKSIAAKIDKLDSSKIYEE